MNGDMTMGDILQYAVQVEHESMTFYKEAVSIVLNPEVKQLVNELKEEEIKHEDRLADILVAADDVPVIGFEKKQLDRMIKNREIPSDASSRMVLEVALEREKLTRDFYRQVSTLTNISVSAIEAFEMLFEQESGHVTRISRMLERL